MAYKTRLKWFRNSQTLNMQTQKMEENEKNA